MPQKSFISRLALALPLLVAACSGSDDSANASLLESCSASYLCLIGGDSVVTRLNKSGDSCYLGSVELRPDGTAPPISGDRTTWSGDADKLTLCSGDACFPCYASPASSGGPSSSGSCSGTADSCSSVAASSCSDQGGCHYTIGSNISSTSDDGCSGTPRPCSDYDDRDGCEGHSGCSWR